MNATEGFPHILCRPVHTFSLQAGPHIFFAGWCTNRCHIGGDASQRRRDQQASPPIISHNSLEFPIAP